jgi:Tfp pilus assembly protein PilF
MHVRRIPLLVLALSLLLTGCGSGAEKTSNQSADQLVQVGLLALQKSDQNAAFSAFTSAVKKDPKNHYAHYNLGYIYQQRGNNVTALQEYQLALASKPDYVPALYNSGTIYGVSDPAHAISIYQSVVKLDPKNGAAYFNLGLLEAQSGNKAQGRKDVERAISLDSSLAKRVPPGLFPDLAPGSPKTTASATASTTK